MEMTLDEFLAEVDRWKLAAAIETRDLTPDERAEHYRRVRAWLESQLGHPLNVAEIPESVGVRTRASEFEEHHL